MTLEEYEQKYAEALDHIGRTHVVKIQTLHSGRATQIDGKWCSDEAVFRRAWGENAAMAIMDQKPTVD
jgi:hypothetical protein